MKTLLNLLSFLAIPVLVLAWGGAIFLKTGKELTHPTKKKDEEEKHLFI